MEKVEPTNPFKGLDELSKEIMKPKEVVKSVSIGDCSDVDIDYGGGCKLHIFFIGNSVA